MSICFLFPGQGTQYPDLFGCLPQHTAVKDTLLEASQILKVNIDQLDSQAALKSTINVQLSLFIAGVASARALAASHVIPAAVAGLSVGAFAAAVICKSLDFADGIALVQKRAQLMENRFPSGFGMSAIVGLNEQTVAQLVHGFYSTSQPVFVSNINAPRQIIIAGCLAGLDKVEEAALKIGAQKAERLNVGVPSHCPLFQPVADSLQEILSKIALKKPTIPYISNIRARPLRLAAAVAEDLANNIAHGVRWHESISVLMELGCDLFVEMNPGSVLSRLGSEAFPDVRFIALEESSLAYLETMAKKSQTK